MFESNEAVRGRLIGPKTWERIDIIFYTKNEATVTVNGCLGVLFHKLCDKSCTDLNEVGNDREMRVHKVNR